MTKNDDEFYNRSITRREALVALGLASAASITGIGSIDRAWADPGAGAGLPNIIFILSDDHRWDHMGCAGHPFLQTPAMDRLAAEGVLFENAFVTTSLCSPSRASFLTGTYAHTHGVKNNITPWEGSNVTFLETMKVRGYETAFIGKWHMPGSIPTIAAIDEFITFTAQGGQGQYFNCPLIVNGKQEPSRKAYITEELTDRAIEFIDSRKDKPFCLYLSHKAVHHQFLPPPDLKGLYDDVELNLPGEFDPWITATKGNLLYGVLGPLPGHYRNYCAALTALDREIDRLLNKLDELAIADNTIVIYAGDNGYFWGEHNLVDKRWAYEESMRIPFIVRWPSRIPDPGRRTGQMILNVDLASTLSDLTGSPMSDRFEGTSFLPVLMSAAAPGRNDWFYEYFPDYPYRVPPQYAVRTSSHKYIEFMTNRKPELYDITHDPREHRNLYGTIEGTQVQKEIKDRLEWYKERYHLNGA
jgi:N-acetylglucosamine-6-sulfatase